MTRSSDVWGELMNYQHSSTIPGSAEWPYFRGGDIPSTIPTNPDPSRSSRIDVETIKIPSPDFRGQRICPNARSTSFCLTRDLCVMALRRTGGHTFWAKKISKRTKPPRTLMRFRCKMSVWVRETDSKNWPDHLGWWFCEDNKDDQQSLSASGWCPQKMWGS